MIERFRLFGDRRKAAQWLPFARKRIAWWKQQNQPGVWNHKWWVPGGEVRVSVDRVAQSEWIWIRIKEGGFWWWGLFWEEDDNGDMVMIVRAADIPEGVSQGGGVITEALPAGYRALPIYRNDAEAEFGVGHGVIVKADRSLRGMIHDFHNHRVVGVTGLDNGRPQQLQPMFIVPFVDEITELPKNPQRIYSFAYRTESAILFGGTPFPSFEPAFKLLRAAYTTPGQPAVVTEPVDVDLSDMFDIPELPGPNGTEGVETNDTSPLFFLGAWQGNNSHDEPPSPEAEPDLDFYLVSLVETEDEVDPGPPVRYQQAVVLRRRSVVDPDTDIMSSSWLLEEWVQRQHSGDTPALYASWDTPVLSWVYEYRGRVFVIFQRYVEDAPGDPDNTDRDWFFDQYVIDKETGELLHTQIDCGIRIWAETDQGIYGYAQPRVTFTHEGEIPTEAHVEWELNKYEFGTGGDEWSLFVARDANDDPIRLLEAVTTYLPEDFPGFFEDMVPTGAGDINRNRMILLQH